MGGCSFMWNLKRNYMNEITYKTETHREGTYGYWGERDSQRVRDGHVHTAIFNINNQQGPTV